MTVTDTTWTRQKCDLLDWPPLAYVWHPWVGGPCPLWLAQGQETTGVLDLSWGRQGTFATERYGCFQQRREHYTAECTKPCNARTTSEGAIQKKFAPVKKFSLASRLQTLNSESIRLRLGGENDVFSFGFFEFSHLFPEFLMI